MDTLPSSSGDLNELERRLAEWRPSSAGLDTDRMLFAAGRNSVRPGWGRIAWPILSGCLALVASTLGLGLVHERTARLDLAAQLDKRQPAHVPPPADNMPQPEAPSPEPPAANSYLATRRLVADGLDRWPILAKADPPLQAGTPNPAIWKAGQRDAVAADLQSAAVTP
jgi:hypothetical protein